jgi:hypothetical protein
MDPEAQRHFTNLGRTLVQVNLRLTQLTELLEGRAGSGAGSGTPTGGLDVLLDLLEAVERTTAAFARPAVAPSPWLARLFGVRPPAPPDLTGLVLARDHAVRQLERAGLVRVPASGPVDVRLHQVLDVRDSDDPALTGTVATTHRTGWYRVGDPPAVVRFAQITAWQTRALS